MLKEYLNKFIIVYLQSLNTLNIIKLGALAIFNLKRLKPTKRTLKNT